MNDFEQKMAYGQLQQGRGDMIGGGYTGLSSPQLYDTAASAAVSPINRLMNALEKSAAHTQHVTDILCGQQPPDNLVKGALNDPSPSGMFSTISVSATRIERMAQTIAECMNRIQRVAG
jgi:hypothetical protein